MFSPLVKLNLPSPEEYFKRKVALISGMSPAARSTPIDSREASFRYHWPRWIVFVSTCTASLVVDGRVTRGRCGRGCERMAGC